MQKWEYKTVVLPVGIEIEDTKELRREMLDLINKGLMPTALMNRNVDSEQLDSELNRLGAEGWELVSTCISTRKGSSVELVATFKRPQQNS